ncbi:hypothetical protein CYJ37_03665 [Bacillus sp. UMB0728]|nr:hypothetical protein CYJ37_03665 [Bacillus sp. UMB0728]
MTRGTLLSRKGFFMLKKESDECLKRAEKERACIGTVKTVHDPHLKRDLMHRKQSNRCMTFI